MTVLVGTANGLFRLDTDGDPRPVAAGRVRTLTASGAPDAWAVVDDALRRLTPDGTWSDAPVSVDADLTTALATSNGVVVGTADARLWRVDDRGAAPLAGFDEVAGRGTWHAVGSAVPYVRSITTTADGEALLASVHVGGIPRSTDDGATWQPTIDVDDDVHEVRAHPDDPTVVAAAAAVGLAESRDGGASWSVAPGAGLHASYLRAVAFADDTVVVGASDGPRGQHAALYRRPLDGGDFARCEGGLPEWLPTLVDTGALAARGALVVAGAGDTVFASDDAARTWRVLASGLPQVRALAVTRFDSASG
jgi:photosystem II stability/assembly factor-like uncharacterized protein